MMSMELKYFRTYLKSDYLGITIYAEKLEINTEEEFAYFYIGGRIISLIDLNRIERIESDIQGNIFWSSDDEKKEVLKSLVT